MMDKCNFILGHGIDIFEKVGRLLAHYDQFVRQVGQLAHDVTIFRFRDPSVPCAA